MRAAMSEKLAVYGQWTYRGAWALEIAASLIGLATGLALGAQAFSSSQTATAMDLTLASAPFFMVAIAELTKIPIATLLFGASWVWKPFILAFLLLLAAITFETVFMGLERAGAMRQLQYEELANSIDLLNNEAKRLTTSEETARNSELVAEAQADLEMNTSLAAAARKALQDQIAEVDAQPQATTVLSPEAARAGTQLREKEQVRASLLAERDKEISEAVSQFEKQRDSFVDRIRMARNAGDNDSAKRMEAEVARLANPRPKLVARFAEQLAPVEAQIAELRQRFDALRIASPAMTSDQRGRLQTRRDELEKALDVTTADWQGQVDQARIALASAQESSSQQASNAAANQVRRDEIAKEISALENERVPLARTDQVRRIASRFYGKKPEEVSETEEGLISVLWFGSLASIAALAGPITAMVALGLQRIAAESEVTREGKLSRILRMILLKWRWRRTKSVRIPVEVVVEKEVEKRIEIPVEVEKVVKEILYVPLFTDNPDDLRRALDQELPPDVIDLVKVSAKGKRRAGSS